MGGTHSPQASSEEPPPRRSRPGHSAPLPLEPCLTLGGSPLGPALPLSSSTPQPAKQGKSPFVEVKPDHQSTLHAPQATEPACSAHDHLNLDGDGQRQNKPKLGEPASNHPYSSNHRSARKTLGTENTPGYTQETQLRETAAPSSQCPQQTARLGAQEEALVLAFQGRQL